MEFIFETDFKYNTNNFVKLNNFEKNLLKKTKDIIGDNNYYLNINDGIKYLFENNIGYPEEIVENYRVGFKSQYQNYHKGYLWYLYTAFMSDVGIEIAPWYLYNVILHQIAQVVKENSEEFRNIFTSSNEKIIIKMYTLEFDIGKYTNIIKNLIPTQTTYETFFPTWTESPEYYNECIQGLFADMAQKYYSAVVLGCSCPKVRVKGTQEDWDKLYQTICELKNIFNTNNIHILDEYLNKVISCTENFKLNLNKKETWKSFFFVTNCGSGHQEGIGGTIRQLLNYSSNSEMLVSQLPSTLSRFPFELRVDNMEKQKDSYFISGLVGSNLDSDGYLVPSYDYAITWINHEATKLDENKMNELLWIRDELDKWEHISIGGKNIKHHFIHDYPKYSNSKILNNEKINCSDEEVFKLIEKERINKLNNEKLSYSHLWFEGINSIISSKKSCKSNKNACLSLEQYLKQFEKVEQYIIKLKEPEYLKKIINSILYLNNIFGITKMCPGYSDGSDIIIGTFNTDVIKLFCELFESQSNYVLDLLLYYLTSNRTFISIYDNNVFQSHFNLGSDLIKYLEKKFFVELKELLGKRICFHIDIKNKYLTELKNKLNNENKNLDYIKYYNNNIENINEKILQLEQIKNKFSN